MRPTPKLLILAAVTIVCGPASRVVALTESTHELVNRVAANASRLDAILKTRLGFADGLQTKFGENSVERWLELGGRREDEGGVSGVITGTARFLRHFHDPFTETWDTAGLDFRGQHESSARWMQRADQDTEIPDGENWGWPRARDEFEAALTAETPDAREQVWADTFRALGQVLHLPVDAGVPEHARNDVHPLEAIIRRIGLRGYHGNYEYWVSDQHGRPRSPEEAAFITTYLSSPLAPDPAVLAERSEDPIAPLPIARLIDTNRYTGADPNVTLTGPIGLAEFANANFFSEDTGQRRLFGRNYPFPDGDRLVRADVPDPAGRVTAYFGKARDDGLPAFPVLAECVFDGFVEFPVRCVDEEVWKQVATEMLPRTVGYSAALLDHFFRGRLEARVQIRKDDAGFHATVRLINRTRDEKNRTPGEKMDGWFSLHYDAADGRRQGLGPWMLVLEPEQSQTIQISPLPAEALAGPWVLAFRGRLGEEADAVVGGLASTLRLHVARLQRSTLSGINDNIVTDAEVDPSCRIVDGSGIAFFFNRKIPVDAIQRILYRNPIEFPTSRVELTVLGPYSGLTNPIFAHVTDYQAHDAELVVYAPPPSRQDLEDFRLDPDSARPVKIGTLFSWNGGPGRSCFDLPGHGVVCGTPLQTFTVEMFQGELIGVEITDMKWEPTGSGGRIYFLWYGLRFLDLDCPEG